MVKQIVFRNGVAVPAVKGALYEHLKSKIENAEKYADAVEALDKAIKFNETGLAGDFCPSEPYAIRFMNATAHALASGRPEGAKAMRLLAELLIGRNPRGRKPVPAGYDQKIVDCWNKWRKVVEMVWTSGYIGHDLIRHGMDQQYRDKVRELRSRPSMRPFLLAAFLASWEMDMSATHIVRCVRTAPPERIGQ